jgi:hypothetical protein
MVCKHQYFDQCYLLMTDLSVNFCSVHVNRSCRYGGISGYLPYVYSACYG